MKKCKGQHRVISGLTNKYDTLNNTFFQMLIFESRDISQFSDGVPFREMVCPVRNVLQIMLKLRMAGVI